MDRQADALLTEHFRYTPLSLIDEIINAVNTIIYRALEAIENGLFSIPPPTLGFSNKKPTPAAENPVDTADADGDSYLEYPEARDEIENGVHQLETLLEATVDKTFDKFEIYTLRNILTVPDDLTGWIRLTHYENINFPLPPTAPTPESILHLRRQLAETKKLNRALRATHTSNLALLSSLSSLLSPSSTNPSPPPPSISFLTTHPAAKSLSLTLSPNATTTPTLITHASFSKSQLPALRALLADLRPKLESLKPENRKEVDWQTRREERRAYLEKRVRKVVKPGEDAGGERRAEEEVRGLEEVLKGLVKDGDGDRDGDRDGDGDVQMGS